ncbi:MAG: HypC/HybG/HupF family hydrogenase formation chaperone [Candidatus Omnitrophota bacterium]
MCLAVPMKIIKIDGDFAVVELDKVRQRANIQMVSKVSVGDFVIIHAGFAIQKVDKKEAEETRDFLRSL